MPVLHSRDSDRSEQDRFSPRASPHGGQEDGDEAVARVESQAGPRFNPAAHPARRVCLTCTDAHSGPYVGGTPVSNLYHRTDRDSLTHVERGAVCDGHATCNAGTDPHADRAITADPNGTYRRYTCANPGDDVHAGRRRGGGEMAREEAGIVVERCLDRYDFSAFRPGDIITVTLAVTNANDAELRGFYFSDQAPNGWIVNTAGVSVNAWTIADYAYVEGVADEVYDGYTPHRWELGMAVFSDSEPDLIEHAIRRKAE